MAVEALRTDFLKPTVTAIERAIQLKGVRKQASVDNNTPAVASPPGD